jgi:hypothetical protein
MIILLIINFSLIFYFVHDFSVYGNYISDFGFSLGVSLMAIFFLFYCKWIQYPLYKTLGQKKYIFGCFYAPLSVVVIFPFLLGAEGNYNLTPLLLSLLILFIPERLRTGEWFWTHRGKNFKYFPDSGVLSETEVNLIRNEYLKSIWGLNIGLLIIFIFQGGYFFNI